MMRLISLFLLLIPLSAAAERWTLSPAFWLTPRSGARILAEPAITQAVGRVLDEPRARLRLHHARDDESQAQAEELKGWLTALGIDPARIELAADGGVDRLLAIEVTAP